MQYRVHANIVSPGNGNIAAGLELDRTGNRRYCNSQVDAPVFAQVHYFYCEAFEHLLLSSPVLLCEIYSSLCVCCMCLLP